MLLCVGARPAVSTELARIDLRLEIEAVRPNVLLGDVAEIHADDPTVRREIADVEICFAPVAGGAREIDRDYVLLRLRQRGLDTTALAIGGADVARITVASTRISAAALAERITTALSEAMPWDVANVEIAPPREIQDLVVPARDPELRVELQPDEDFLGSTLVYVSASVAGQQLRRQAYRFDIAVYHDVLVAARALARGALLTEGDLRTERIDIAPLRGRYYTDAATVSGLQLRRSIHAGTRLEPALLEAAPAVGRGEYVRLSVAGRGFELSAGGRALEQGMVGSVIRVELATDRRIYARVTGPGTATLVE